MSPQTLPAEASAAAGAPQADDEWVPEPPNIDHLVFEDGSRVDNLFAERQMRLFVDPLYISWKGPPKSGKFVAMANVGLFPEAQQTPLVPDGLLSTDVAVPGDPHRRQHRSYLLWVYGKPPDVILEIVSDRNGGELDGKLRRYTLIGIAYYVVFDPEQFLGEQTVHFFRREGGTFTPLSQAWFPEMGLGLKLWTGVFEGVEAVWLRWHDSTGGFLATGEEQAIRARKAEEQAERLLAQLRAAGITPDL